jgi:hypothetical protein
MPLLVHCHNRAVPELRRGHSVQEVLNRRRRGRRSRLISMMSIVWSNSYMENAV